MRPAALIRSVYITWNGTKDPSEEASEPAQAVAYTICSTTQYRRPPQSLHTLSQTPSRLQPPVPSEPAQAVPYAVRPITQGRLRACTLLAYAFCSTTHGALEACTGCTMNHLQYDPVPTAPSEPAHFLAYSICCTTHGHLRASTGCTIHHPQYSVPQATPSF